MADTIHPIPHAMRYTLSLLTALTCILTALHLRADTGTWDALPIWGSPATQVTVTPRHAYYLSGGSVLERDLLSDVSTHLSPHNRLSTAEPVTGLYPNPLNGYVAACHADGTIDLLYTSGRNVAIPDIALAELTGSPSRRINAIAYDAATHTMAVATDFGLVLIDDRDHTVRASGQYGQPVLSVAIAAGRLYINSGQRMLTAPLDGRIDKLARWTELCGWYQSESLTPLDDNLLLVHTPTDTGNMLALLHVAPDHASAYITVISGALAPDRRGYLITAKAGLYYALGTAIYTVGTDGTLTRAASLPEEAEADIPGFWNGLDNVHLLGPEGIITVDASAGEGKVTSERYMPEGVPVRNAVTFSPSADGKRLYAGNLGPTNYRMGNVTGTDAVDVPHTAGLIDLTAHTGRNVTAWPAPAAYPMTAGYQKAVGEYPLAPTHMCPDPDDPETYWLGTGNDGLYRIAAGRLDGRYDTANSPMSAAWGVRVFDVSVDRAGNLWVIYQPGDSHSGIAVLPAAKRRLHPDEVKSADWTLVDIPGYKANKDAVTLHCRLSNMIFITDAGLSNVLVAIDTRGTWDNLADDVSRLWNGFTDQDGKTFSPDRHTSLCEDRNGRLWLGTATGIAMLPNPKTATSPDMRITRVKVPRNDGTNTADYLASSDLVTAIAADEADRKWIATDASGLMLVSSNGDAVLKHFTPDNSPLPSSRVNDVHVAPDGTVWLATEAGIVTYTDAAAASGEPMAALTAYPNPAKVSEGHNVTVRGLTAGAIVKFTDAAGHLVHQTRATADTVTWDLCNQAGRPVPSGVYYIMASLTGDTAETLGAVTKILVIN